MNKQLTEYLETRPRCDNDESQQEWFSPSSTTRASTVSETSKFSYRLLQQQGQALTDRLKIYELLLDREEGLTDIEISLWTGLTKNNVNGRIGELKREGVVYDRVVKRFNTMTNRPNVVRRLVKYKGRIV